jgi:hypothetical protein
VNLLPTCSPPASKESIVVNFSFILELLRDLLLPYLKKANIGGRHQIKDNKKETIEGLEKSI